MTIVITGAAGLIGSGVVRHLNDEGMKDLLLVDDLKFGDKWKNLVGKSFTELISKHDLFAWLDKYGSTVQAVIHLGACSDTTETNGDYLLENNTRYTIRLARWALEKDKRLIYASSAATYGDGSQGFGEHLLETLQPLNLYGFSKQMADLWLLRHGALDKVAVLKYFNVFGPNEYHKGHMASMVLKMAGRVRKGEGVSLYKSNDPTYLDGEQVRDFIYVKDAVKMTCALLNTKEGGIFNIGRGTPVTWNRLASSLFASLGMEPNITYVDLPDSLKKQYQNYTCAEVKRFFKIIPYRFQPIEESVAEYVQEYLVRDARW